MINVSDFYPGNLQTIPNTVFRYLLRIFQVGRLAMSDAGKTLFFHRGNNLTILD